MKDTSRPHSTPSSRSAPYRKRKSSGAVSPTRGARRAHDASKSQGQMISPRPPERAHSSRRNEGHSRTISFADNEHHSLSKTGGIHNATYTRKVTNPDESVRERSSCASVLSIHADVPGPSLRLPLTSTVSPATNTFVGQSRAESPPVGSVTTFLRSIELPDKPTGEPPHQPSFSFTPPSFRLPTPLSANSTDKATCTNGNDYQVSLVYKGYPFTYDLSALPDDPKGTIALLTITKSDPGAYILVGAHYRRTGRSRAACAVIRSLLDNLDSPSDLEKAKGDATPSDNPTATLPSPGLPPCPTLIERTMSVFKGAAMRPALLLLAACELDISREHPDGPESDEHASTAHELFRAVYGVMNDGIVAGAVRPQSKNALGLEFSSNRNCPSISPEVAPLTRAKELEKELSAARAAQQTLQEKLAVSDDRLTCAEDKVRALESHSREMHIQLDASRDENWELRQRLAESEQRARELAHCTPSVESRVWGRLKDLLFDNLGGSMRGE